MLALAISEPASASKSAEEKLNLMLLVVRLVSIRRSLKSRYGEKEEMQSKNLVVGLWQVSVCVEDKRLT